MPNWGTIVTFTSLSAMYGAPLHGPYGAAKAAVRALTKTMAVEWGPHQIRVNAVAPGWTSSSRSGARRVVNDQDPTARVPLQRGADLSEIAAAVLFLTSDLSAGITGQTLNLDAGASANQPMGGLDLWQQYSTPSENAG